MSRYAADCLRAQDCRAAATRLSDADIVDALGALPGWSADGAVLYKIYTFADFHGTIGFVNAIAWIANAQDHHPDLDVHFNRCGVAFSTHDTGGITLNDLICAARVDALGA